MNGHCLHCPVPEADRPCAAVVRDCPRYCQLVDPSHPDYDTGYVAIVGAKVIDMTPEGPVAPVVERERISNSRRLQLVTCLYRDQGCGCAAPKCWWKGGSVYLSDCNQCHP